MAFAYGSRQRIFHIFLWYILFALAGAVKPGLKARVSQTGLNYAATVAVDVLATRLQQVTIPDQSGRADIKIGKVDYEFKNMKVDLIYSTVIKGFSSKKTL